MTETSRDASGDVWIGVGWIGVGPNRVDEITPPASSGRDIANKMQKVA